MHPLPHPYHHSSHYFYNHTTPTQLYTLSLHDALPIAAKYKAGKQGPVILIGHSLGANAVMLIGQELDKRGIPVALIVPFDGRSEEHTSELQSLRHLVCRLLLEKKKKY